jgi:predicted ATP-grasp superfamily ATP-dependent carboligase
MPPRILLSEGSSLSAREAITALGRAGHRVEICDPARLCLGRFSRYVRRFHRCPPMGEDPAGYLDFVLALLARRRFDVLLPTHEQAFLFARMRDALPPSIGLALPSFEAFSTLQSKASFYLLLEQMRLPYPESRIVRGKAELLRQDRFPVYVKTAIGTASRGVWRVGDSRELERVVSLLEMQGSLDGRVIFQEPVAGVLERAQVVFDQGRLVASHVYRQIAPAPGGGDILKQSVRRPEVREHLARLGRRLQWHGAMSVDLIYDEKRRQPFYIDTNPRLVEPVNALLSGVNLAELLVRISLGESPPTVPEGREGVRTRQAIQALLGSAIGQSSRTKLLAECWRLFRAAGPYAGTVEELTPFRDDPPSALAVAGVALQLLVNPRLAHGISANTSRAHQLNLRAARYIRDELPRHSPRS